MTAAAGPQLALAVPPRRRRAARAAVLQVAKPPRPEALVVPLDATGAGFTGRRHARTVRSRGAAIEIAWVEGRLHAAGASWPWARLELRWLSGPRVATAWLAARWQQRLGLCADPFPIDFHARHDRGEPPPLRRAGTVALARDADAPAALRALAAECLAQVEDNAAALALALPGTAVERVHQLRVGVRRLRSVLRLFRGWTVEPPPEPVAGLQALFRTLGADRDAAVFDQGIAAELAAAGAPRLQATGAAPPADAGRTLREPQTQQLLLAWRAWLLSLEDVPADPSADLPRRAAKRLARWHAHLVEAARGFEHLDDDALHAWRKDVKRQRYAVELLQPLWGRRAAGRYLERLAALQEALGTITDLLSARSRCQAVVDEDPAAWFALGWLAARLAEARLLIRPVLGRFVRAEQPWA